MTQKEISAVFEEMRSLCNYRNIQGRENGFNPCNNCLLRGICWGSKRPNDLTHTDITKLAKGIKKWSDRF